MRIAAAESANDDDKQSFITKEIVASYGRHGQFLPYDGIL